MSSTLPPARSPFAPTLETERLRLRGFQVGDLESQAKMLSDPEVLRHLGATAFSREDSWRRLLSAPGLWAVLGFGYWAMERKQDGAVIGQIGFADYKRDMTPNIEGLPEIGWILATHAHGQGYAGEAAAAALAWADTAQLGDEIVAIISHANGPSIRLAERMGFTVREEALYRGEPILLFRRRAVPRPVSG